MIKNNIQNKNSLNLFLNEYFNVLVVLLLVIIFTLAYFLLIGPKFSATVTVIKENIEMQKKIYAEQEKKFADLKIIKDVYDQISLADLSKFNGILPQAYVKEQLFGELEEIIVNSGFLINSVAISSDEVASDNNGEAMPPVETEIPTIGSASASAGERVGKIMITVSVGAIDYSGFKSLLRTIEANSRLFDVESVNFSEGGNSADLQLVTYYYKSLK
ncbi:MAG: hypothetical protein WCT50_04770 [Patescibacteria group bacterium]|jgi:hypothetical protein